ncbi:MAG: nitrilase-related carbon-nitrogen hydrolase [Owenweeksia sp.]|nr:nitrilase-related carbon-nitrogen hydrolase [Owenweeksia sp.]
MLKLGTAISGSAIIKDQGNYYNRLYFVRPDGTFHNYDKKHLFTLAGEEKIYAPGQQQLIVEYKGWRLMPLICYDLRFPVWCRNTQEVDMQFYLANWPERRCYSLESLAASACYREYVLCSRAKPRG